MAGEESYEMRGSSSFTANLMAKEEKKSGCFVSTLTGFILLLGALVLAVGVGVIVYFAAVRNDAKDLKCSVDMVSR